MTQNACGLARGSNALGGKIPFGFFGFYGDFFVGGGGLETVYFF